MIAYSTREAAKKLGITEAALSRYIKAGKVPTPKIVQIGRMKLHSWSEADIENLRQLLPKIKNGRKTRYLKSKKPEVSNSKNEEEAHEKKKPEVGSQKLVGAKKKPQPEKAGLRKKKH